MPSRLRNGILLVLIILSSVAGGSLRSGQDESATAGVTQLPAPNESAEHSAYIGSDRCIVCHREQAHVWSETGHALAYEHLPDKYREDPACLKCHITGYGESGGYHLGMEEDEAQTFLSVGCESCHGPGAAHEEAVKRWTMSDPADEEKLLAEMKGAIVKSPTVSQCATCHTNQAHQAHPAYDGQPASRTGFHSARKVTAASINFPHTPDTYSVKTCGSCHLVQYRQWRAGKHVDLTNTLPAKYQNDESCLECHRPNLAPWDWFTPSAQQVNVNEVGVGCESCHGPALEHVLFNRQFIAGPQLGPELEEAARQTIRQGQPVGACVQCHVRDAHQQHPAYEQPDGVKVE